MKIEIKFARIEIDTIDEEIINLIKKRNNLASKIIMQKISDNVSIYDKKREDEITGRLMSISPELEPELIKDLYSVIFHHSQKKHYKKAEEPGKILATLRNSNIIAGPVVSETREDVFKSAGELSEMGIKILKGKTFVPNYLSRPLRGTNEKIFFYFREAATKYNMLLLYEVNDEHYLEQYYDMTDMIMINHTNNSEPGLADIIGRITLTDNKPVILRRGFCSTIQEFSAAADYLTGKGNYNIILCHRGIRIFTRPDAQPQFDISPESINYLKEKTGLRVLFDPSGFNVKTEEAMELSEKAFSSGADGLIIETSHEQSSIPAQKGSAFSLGELRKLMEKVKPEE